MNKNFKKFISQNISKKNCIRAGRFDIFLPDVFGFCGGVITALKKLERTVRQCNGIKIFLLGEIIHNPTVNEYFAELGVEIIPENNLDSIFTKASYADIVIIPAFGIPLSLEYKLRKYFHNIVDTTCVNVRSVWKFITEKNKKGYSIILHGKPGHPEVQASVSRAISNSTVIILPDTEKAEIFSRYFETGFPELPEKGKIEIDGIHWVIDRLNLNKFALSNQTTMLFNETRKIEHILKNTLTKYNKELVSCNTICKATYRRQKAAEKISIKNLDLSIVVGGYDSSNTNHLYSLSCKYNKQTIYLKDSDSLNNDNIISFEPDLKKELKLSTGQLFDNINSIGILAGASCPFSEIEKLINKISALS